MACVVKKNRSPCAACRGLHKKCDTSEGYPCKGCKSSEQKAYLCRPSRIRKSLRTKKVDGFRLSTGEQLGSYQGIAATNNSFHEVQADAANYFQNAGNVANNDFQALPMLGACVQDQHYVGGNGPPFDNMQESKSLTTMNSRLASFGVVSNPNVQANQVFEHGHSGQPTHGDFYTFHSDAYYDGVPSYDQDAPLNICELGDGQGTWLPENSFDKYPARF